MSAQTYYPQPPGGGFFQNFGFGGALGPLDPDVWRSMPNAKKNIQNFQDLPAGFWSKGQNPMGMTPIEAITIPYNPAGATNLINKSGVLGTETGVEGGTVVGKNRPTGVGRVILGGIDKIGLGTDLDRRGDGGGKENPNTGFGEIAPDYTKTDEGKIVKDTTEEDLAKEIAKEKRELDNWNQKVDKLEGVGERGADKQALRKGIFGLSTNMQAGLDNAADIHRQGLASFATIASNLPRYSLPTMSMRTPSFKYF